MGLNRSLMAMNFKVNLLTSAIMSPGIEFSGMATEYSVLSRDGTTSLTSFTVISMVAVELSGLLPTKQQNIVNNK